MPTLGSVSGTYGYGRSPQTLPPPGFTYRTTSTVATWNLSNGPFVLSGNISAPSTGNVYVITPSSTFTCNVKIWGGGGGGIYGDIYTQTTNGDVQPGVFTGAGGGAVEATVTFEMGQPYTIFAGGAGDYIQGCIGVGGAASGILQGNIFQSLNIFQSYNWLETAGLSQMVANVVLAAGGGAGASLDGAGSRYGARTLRLPGAGGGQVGDGSEKILSGNEKSESGIGSRIGSISSSYVQKWFAGIEAMYRYSDYSPTQYNGGGPGGTVDANIRYNQMSMLGGNSYISANIDGILSSRAVTGTYGIAGLYDNNYKSFFGDSGKPGRVVLYLDEYRTTSITATGGAITTVPIPGYELQYKYHTFTSNGKFTVNSTVSSDTVDVFVVGGGGGGADAGGGGGGVVLKTGLQITTGNYLVHVGSGGAAQNSLSSDIGGYWGGYPGDHSAFYNNQLNQYFPDNYHRLIYSFNTAVYFISATADDTVSNGSLAFPFSTIRGAMLRTNDITDLIVFAVLPGTYNPPESEMNSGGFGYTQVIDDGLPRVWVCSPGKVTITFTDNVSLGGANNYSEPCVILNNQRSAVYGAVFQRDTNLEKSNGLGNPIFRSTSGLLQNCVIKDTGPWAFFNRDVRRLRIVNSVFYTSGNSIAPGWNNARGESSGDIPANINSCLLQNSAFNYTYTVGPTNLPTIDNCAINLRANINAGTYRITNVSDKGVYAGPYGWGGVTTKPESKAVAVTMVAPGGGGGGNIKVVGYRVNNHGGSSGGAGRLPSEPGIVHQLPWLANLSYSSYGYPGGRSSAGDEIINDGAGGGGAAFPGRSNSPYSQISEGGLGIEWPYGSQTYYGSGGNGKPRDPSFANYSSPVVHGAGQGGHGGSAGDNGAVIVRYVTAGPYTPPEQFVRTENLVATGGNITIANGYKEHRFFTSGVFSICNLPDNAYIDILAVGGGRGGNASKTSTVNSGGRGGEQFYQRLDLNSTSIYNYAVAVGAGGQGGATTTNSGSYGNGAAGNPSSITLPSYTIVATKISAAGGPGYGNALPGSLTTSGLFSDNTEYYGGGGANGGGPTYAGGIGGGGHSNGGYGVSGTGGGGGGGEFGNYYFIPSYYTSYGYVGGYYVNGYSTGGNGGSGLVIIRYPYNP